MKTVKKILILALLTGTFTTPTHAQEPISPLRTVAQYTLVAAGSICAYKTYELYSEYSTLTRTSERFDYLIKHKQLFIRLYWAKQWTRAHMPHFLRPTITAQTLLKDWIEARIIGHLMNNSITSVKDLPWLDRMVIKALDGKEKLNLLAQKAVENLEKRLIKQHQLDQQ